MFHQPRIEIDQVVAEDIEAERQRVYRAFDKMRDQIDALGSEPEFGKGGEHVEVLETYKMFAYDEGWSRRINEAIDSGLTAEAAIERVQQRTRMRMREIDDPLLADRMHDLEDLSNRLLRIVSGQLGTAATQGLATRFHPDCAQSRPSRTARIRPSPPEGRGAGRRLADRACGDRGAGDGHSRAGPRRRRACAGGEGDEILLDADKATVTLRPGAALLDAFEARFVKKREQQATYAELRDVEPFTRDGTRITVMMNAGLRDDMSMLQMTGADGVGLFRTEFQFLVSATLPQRDRQLRLYRDVLDAAGDKPVIFRTVDIGGDKAVPYLDSPSRRAGREPGHGLARPAACRWSAKAY